LKRRFVAERRQRVGAATARHCCRLDICGIVDAHRNAQVTRVKCRYLIPVTLLTGCSWWHGHSWFHKKPVPEEPTQLIVNGAPADSILLIDGAVAGTGPSLAGKPQLVAVAPGMHTVEVKLREKIAYRESTYVAPGEKHVVVVLSGNRGE
jgi:hypothetical protein